MSFTFTYSIMLNVMMTCCVPQMDGETALNGDKATSESGGEDNSLKAQATGRREDRLNT